MILMTENHTSKKILFVTGTRADFGKLKPLMLEVENSSLFDCHIFATGMHMMPLYGLTVLEIKKIGFSNIFSHINQDSDTNRRMDLALAMTIQGLSHYVHSFKTDLIVVHGDRVEALAGAAVGALNNILTAHIEGGELSGTVDELLRHSITKLSHVHFVANETARNRLVQLGETPDSIFVIGSPDIDIMISDSLPTLEKVQSRYDIPFKEYGIFIYHPVTFENNSLKKKIDEVVSAIEDSGLKFVIIYPNNDTGSDLIFSRLKRLEGSMSFRLVPSLRFEYFLTLLKHAKVIVGNSSSGIREAPLYGVPTINIGSRQMNRYLNKTIINVPEDRVKILGALENIERGEIPSYHFGKGGSAKLFMEQLHDPQFWKRATQKQFRDLGTPHESPLF